MKRAWSRREFLKRSALQAAAAAAACGLGVRSAANDLKSPELTLTTISGKPRERGRQYGRAFKDSIHAFLNKELYAAFDPKKTTRETMLRYAGACSAKIKPYAPIIYDELEGVAEGTGLKVEELVLLTLHEELYHKGVLPSEPHCTAITAGPPDTLDGNTYVGQTWDWMASVYGLSAMLLWKRPEGPSLLCYAYPGLWVGAGINSAGIAFCWTSAFTKDIAGPRVGIPSYVLIAQMLYQDTLKAALEEARRATHAGWFTVVLADGEGRLANVEGSPKELAIETGTGHMARVSYGSRKMTGTPEDKPVRHAGRCGHMCSRLEGARGKMDREKLQGFLSDHGKPGELATAVCVHGSTLDAMLFNTTKREAHVTRGPACSGRWKTFRFQDG